MIVLHGVIYKITNEVNGKIYIGKTTADENYYWEWHKSSARRGVNKVLYHSMRKHGVEKFSFTAIHDVLAPDYHRLNKTLNSLEIRYIRVYNSKAPNGYNLTDGGDGTVGHKRSEEFKERLRVIKTGKSRPEWVKAKLRKPKSESHKAKLKKPKTDTHKRRLSESWSKKTDEEKKLIFEMCIANRRGYVGENNPFYGKKHSSETIELIRRKNSEYQNREDVKLLNKMNQPSRIGVDMINPESNKIVKSFITLTDAKRWIANNTRYKGDVGTLSKAVKNGNKSYGYYWIDNTEVKV